MQLLTLFLTWVWTRLPFRKHPAAVVNGDGFYNNKNVISGREVLFTQMFTGDPHLGKTVRPCLFEVRNPADHISYGKLKKMED